MLDDIKKTLWATADKLRANMDAAEYKHLVLGLIFLKYVSDSVDCAQRESVRATLRLMVKRILASTGTRPTRPRRPSSWCCSRSRRWGKVGKPEPDSGSSVTVRGRSEQSGRQLERSGIT